MTTSNKLTKKELNQVFWRSFGLEWSWNYERQMNMSYCYSMLPVIKKLYPNKEDQVAAMKRHLEFFNTTPQLATLILGISAAMEESNANDPEFDTESINSVKVSLMGPLAGIGDSFIWGTLRIIATGVGLSLANQGNILGPILFLLIFNLPAQGLRYYLMNTGYKLGSGFLAKIQQNGLMSKLTYAASVLGLMVVGGMTAENVAISFPLKFGSGNEATTLNDVFNNIMPGLMPLLFTLLVYYLLKKKNVKTTTLLLICVVIGLIGAAIPLGILYVLYGRIIDYIGEKFSFISNMMKFLPVDEVFHTLVPVALILGVGIGFIGSRITIRKHLKV